MLIYNWACDPLVRSMSFNQSEISLETHNKWFNDKLVNNSLLILENENEQLGQLHIDEKHEVGIIISPSHRGKGFGVEALKLIEIRPLIAHIKHENLASKKIFEQAGFKLKGEVEFKGHRCLEYIKL